MFTMLLNESVILKEPALCEYCVLLWEFVVTVPRLKLICELDIFLLVAILWEMNC